MLDVLVIYRLSLIISTNLIFSLEPVRHRVEMTNVNLFVAIMTTLFILLTTAREPLVSSDIFFISLYCAEKGNYQSIRSKANNIE